jgi:hypothetical protein
LWPDKPNIAGQTQYSCGPSPDRATAHVEFPGLLTGQPVDLLFVLDGTRTKGI